MSSLVPSETLQESCTSPARPLALALNQNQPAGANSQAQSRCSGMLGLTDSQDPVPSRVAPSKHVTTVATRCLGFPMTSCWWQRQLVHVSALR